MNNRYSSNVSYVQKTTVTKIINYDLSSISLINKKIEIVSNVIT
jgi:hypothetical protein